MDKRTIIKRSDYHKSNFKGWVIIAIITFIIGSVVTGYLFLENRDNTYSSASDAMVYIIIIMLPMIFSGFLSFLLASIAQGVGKSFICVCNQGVYGNAVKAGFASTVAFEVEYNQITNVIANSGRLELVCGPYTYNCV